jgi:hypothetical protein
MYLVGAGGGSLGGHHDLLVPVKETSDTIEVVEVLKTSSELVIEGANGLGAQFGG